MSNYWSSSTFANGTGFAWRIHFSYDYGSPSYSKSNAYYVRAVRGGQAGSLGHLVINGDGTATEVSTGLMWQQAEGAKEMTWDAAISYCEKLSLAGYADWRLPNLKELRSIIDHSEYAPSIDTTYFPNTVSSYYWSSTTVANHTNSAWLVDFLYGVGYWRNKSYDLYVRAVRGGQNWLLGHLVISSPAQASTWDVGSVMPIRWGYL